jgi:hypothetical protein
MAEQNGEEEKPGPTTGEVMPGGNAGGSGSSNIGVYTTGAGAAISTLGSGTLTVLGTGAGNTNSGSDYGVYVLTSGIISAANGNLSVTGLGGGAGTGSSNIGVYTTGAGSTIETTGSGNVSVTGTGGNGSGSGNSNYGLYVTGANGIQATGTGSITVSGTGSASSGGANIGIRVSSGSITGASGDSVSVTGTGGNDIGVSNWGVYVGGAGAAISTLGTGTLTVLGTGAGTLNSSNDYGVEVASAGIISAANGNLSVTGLGGGAGTGSSNIGVLTTGAGSTIQTTGSGNVLVTGTGGNGSGSGGSYYGVYVNDVNGIQTTGTGSITVNGTGSASSGGNNWGVVVLSGSITGASGDNLSITGLGGNGSGNSNVGVYVGTGTISTLGTGTLTVLGTGAGTGNSSSDFGVEVLAAGVISAANGNLLVTGLGGGAGTGGSNYGVYTTGAGSTIQTTGSGNVLVTGTGGNATGSGVSNFGVYVTDANGIQATGTGSITVNGTGSTSSGGNNDGMVLVGGSITGASGQNILINGTSGGGSGTYGFSADSASSVNATGSGNITLVTDVDYFGAASTLTTGSGRWLVYSVNPANNNNDTALSNNFRRFSCVYGGSCPAFPATGNGLLYSTTPVLTATPAGLASITYGSAAPGLTGYGYTLSGYLGSDSAADSLSGALNGTTTYTSASPVGTYNINYGSGSLASALGYGFSYANNASAFTVTPKALTITANSFGKTYGTTYSFLGSEFTDAGLVNGDTVSNVSLTSAGAAGTSTVAGGPYAISGSGAVGTGLSNYTISYVNGTLTVNPAALTITANSFGKTYGTTYSFLGSEFTDTGLVNGDTVSGLTLSSPGTAPTATVVGGPYSITGSAATGAGLSNYTISYVNSNLTVNPAALTITANSFGKTYGTTYSFLGTEFTDAGLVNGNTVTGITLSSPGAAGTATVAGGPYAITGSTATGTGLSNYTVSYVNGALTVNPAALTITANSFGKTYGTTYSFLGSEFTDTGLVNGDTVSSVNLASAGAVVATAPVGPYAITASNAAGTGLSNYTINYVDGFLIVVPLYLPNTVVMTTQNPLTPVCKSPFDSCMTDGAQDAFADGSNDNLDIRISPELAAMLSY